MDREDLFMIVKSVLSTRPYRPVQDQNSSCIHAAILIPLFKENGEYKVLFTKRTNRVETHKGQISFPGGAVDKEDGSLKETALREAYEEIGLLRKDVTILGQIDDVLTIVSDFIIHPFVGHIPHPYAFKINPYEVENIIAVPFEIFREGGNGEVEDEVVIDGVNYPGPAFTYQGECIWGASARIVENFMDIIKSKLDLLAEGK